MTEKPKTSQAAHLGLLLVLIVIGLGAAWAGARWLKDREEAQFQQWKGEQEADMQRKLGGP